MTSSFECREAPPVSVLFFSRGRGHGHAVPDMAIAEALSAIDSRIELKFASYATGAETFRSAGVPVIDLGLPENNPFIETLSRCYRMIDAVRPPIVIAHEEFAAMAAAKIAGVPAIFVSAWLPPIGSVSAESLVSAASILVIERPGLFPVPPGATAPVHYVGPILRKMAYTSKDRTRLREELGLADDALAVLMVQGGWANEERAPAMRTVLSAFRGLERRRKRLFWLAGKDAPLVRREIVGLPDIQVFEFFRPIEKLMAACDLVITKGTRGVTLDAASVGVPSLSLSFANNPIDDALVGRIRNNTALNAKAVTGEMLARYIEEIAAARPRYVPNIDGFDSDGAASAARVLATEVRRVLCAQAEPVAYTGSEAAAPALTS
jgi:UDP-N-acetylglucosamine:LPS N-acetylglucosamine transferase